MKIDKNYTKQLLDNYFEGQTSLQEEQYLRNYFRRDDIDESLMEYKPMFDFFNDEREMTMIEENNVIELNTTKRPTSRRIWIYRVGTGVAASIMLFLGVKFAFFNQQKDTQTQSIVYIDGKKFTDMKTIQLQTLDALENISESSDDIIETQIDILNSFNDF